MKLFEFAEPLDENIIQIRNIRRMCILIDQHVLDRANGYRQIPMDIVDAVVKRIPDVRNKIKSLDVNAHFLVWSKSLQVGVGCAKLSDRDGYPRLLVATTFNRLYDSNNNLFLVG